MKISLSTLTFISGMLVIAGCQKEALPVESLNIETIYNVHYPAVFKVANVFGNDMVVQRDKPLSFFGSAPQGHTITVKPTWDSKTYSATVDATHFWKVVIDAAPANTNAQQIVVKDNNTATVTLSNILIGDVWVFSGQSNMEMPLDSVSAYPLFEGVINYPQEIAAANYPNIRLMDINEDFETAPILDLKTVASWQICNPTNAKNFSAVAYYFGRKLQTSLNVPVGLIVSCSGGSYCEAWVSQNKLQSDPILNSYNGQHNSSQLYNGMIYPIRNTTIKGFVWYQGEANRFDNFSYYTALTSALVKNFRSAFSEGSLPFYYVQVAPYDIYYNNGSSPEDNDYAFFREAQAKVKSNVGNTGMAITMDVGDIQRIHPKDKKPVGERLALLALDKTYATGVQSAGPQYISYSVDANNKATINFKSGTANGLTTKNNAPLAQFFFLAGTDHIFRKGSAVISGTKIIITPPADLPLPILSVRYAFTNFPITNLQNSSGLPAEPFRSDTWDEVIY